MPVYHWFEAGVRRPFRRKKKPCRRHPSSERQGDRLAVPVRIIWTECLKYRAALRGFDLATLESIIRSSSERYHDAETGRVVVVGRHAMRLVVIPCDGHGDIVTPVTVHAITRQQTRCRLSTGRFGRA